MACTYSTINQRGRMFLLGTRNGPVTLQRYGLIESGTDANV